MLLEVTQELLKRERLTPSSVGFLFDDDDRILAHPRMSEILGREVSGTIPSLRETDMGGVLKAIREWRVSGISEQWRGGGPPRPSPPTPPPAPPLPPPPPPPPSPRRSPLFSPRA